MTGWPVLFTNRRRFLGMLLLVAAIGGAWIACTRPPSDQPETQAKASAQVGFVAPDFALPALDAQAMSLAAQRGHVVLVNLWASWCGPCRSEMPAINRVYQSYRDAGFVVLAVNATYQDDETDARSLVGSLGLTFPILFDRDGGTGLAYRLRSLPTSYFIGRDGVIREIAVGAMSETILEARVKRLLAEGR